MYLLWGTLVFLVWAGFCIYMSMRSQAKSNRMEDMLAHETRPAESWPSIMIQVVTILAVFVAGLGVLWCIGKIIS